MQSLSVISDTSGRLNSAITCSIGRIICPISEYILYFITDNPLLLYALEITASVDACKGIKRLYLVLSFCIREVPKYQKCRYTISYFHYPLAKKIVSEKYSVCVVACVRRAFVSRRPHMICSICGLGYVGFGDGLTR